MSWQKAPYSGILLTAGPNRGTLRKLTHYKNSEHGYAGDIPLPLPLTTMFAAARSLCLAATRSGNYAVSPLAIRACRREVTDVHTGSPAVDDCQEYELQGQR